MNFRQILLTIILLIITTFEQQSEISGDTPYDFSEGLNKEENELNSMIITEMSNYMNTKKPDCKIEPELILETCDKYNIDPRLVLAQGWIESHWGTAGMAAKTNSVFNVGATGVEYEKIHSKYKYETPNHSIEPYLKLISERYLSTNKTEHDLLNNFVDIDNKRYAESTTYESDLKVMWNKINKETNLDSLINVRREKYVVFTGLHRGYEN
jgi:uncharacterized FlgJ-related protein